MTPMEPNPIYDRLVTWAGSRNKLARAFGITHQALINWRNTGVPAKRVVEVEKVTGIPREELRPDIFRPDISGG